MFSRQSSSPLQSASIIGWLIVMGGLSAIGANWSMETPAQNASIYKSANISGGGSAAAQQLGWTLEFWHRDVSERMTQSTSGTSTGPPGMPQMATWSGTLSPPSLGWPTSGTKLVRLNWFSPVANHIDHTVQITTNP